MDEFLRNFLLVLCGIGAVALLVVAYLWYFVFGKSLRAVLMAGLSILMNRDSTIDLDADVEIKKRPEEAKKEMTQEIAALDFNDEVASHSPYVQQATIDEGFGAQAVEADNKQELVSSSFGTGRFRRVLKSVMRPFLRLRMQSDSDTPARNIQQGHDANNSE